MTINKQFKYTNHHEQINSKPWGYNIVPKGINIYTSNHPSAITRVNKNVKVQKEKKRK